MSTKISSARHALALVATVAILSLSTCDLLSASLFGPSLTYAQAWFDARSFASEAGISKLNIWNGRFGAKNVTTIDTNSNKDYSAIVLFAQKDGPYDPPFRIGLLDQHTLKLRKSWVSSDLLGIVPEVSAHAKAIGATGTGPIVGNLGIAFSSGEISAEESKLNLPVDSPVEIMQAASAYATDQAVVIAHFDQYDPENGAVNIVKIAYVSTANLDNSYVSSDDFVKWIWSEEDPGISEYFAVGAIDESNVGFAFFHYNDLTRLAFARVSKSELINLAGQTGYLSDFKAFDVPIAGLSSYTVKGVWIAHDRVIVWGDEGETEKLMAISFDGKNRSDFVLEGSSLRPISFAQGIDSTSTGKAWKYWLAYDEKSGMLYMNNPWWEQ